MLYATMIFVAGVSDYAAGLGDHRPFNVSYLMLIVLLVFVIVDIDRPRRGLIEVNRDGPVKLRATMDASRDPSGKDGGRAGARRAAQ